jgi:DNA repair protein RadD
MRCSCCGKIPYNSLEEAEASAAKHPYRVEAYFKPACGSWHLTGSQFERAKRNRAFYMTKKIQLRDYQVAAVDALFKYFAEHTGNPVVAMPTGTGKSLVIAEFIRRACQTYPTTRVMMLTHVKELIQQDMRALISVWPSAPAGVYSAGLRRREASRITFAGIQSVYTRPQLFGFIDLILIDECHLVSGKDSTSYRQFINELKKTNPALKVIGFSATPYRLGQGMLTDPGGLFTDICFDLTSRDSFNWMIAQGWVSKLIPKHTRNELDVHNVRVHGGEFVLAELQAAIDRMEVTRRALEEAVQLAEGRRHWLVFATGIDHAEHVADELEHLGISAASVHSKMSDGVRDERRADFESGKLRALVNNNVLTTGYDFPKIDCIIMLRPTASPGLWVQMLGRGTRPVYPDDFDVNNATVLDRTASLLKHDCLVLDFAGNTARLGPINDPVIPKRKGKGPPGIAPVRLCGACGCYSHAAAAHCEVCGAEFPRKVKIETSASQMELVAGPLPVIEKMPVSQVIYRLHQKEGKPATLRVDYYSGVRRFSEYISIEHNGYAGHQARKWWAMRAPMQWGFPKTAEEALTAVNWLKVPATISVETSKKYPGIANYEFE